MEREPERESIKVRSRRWLQRFLLTSLSRSLEKEVLVDYAQTAPLLELLVKERSAEAVQVTRRLVGDRQADATDDASMDALINFSAYWRDEWMATKAAEVPAGATVLDAGAGQCRYKPLFAHADYKAQDFAQYQGTVDGPLQETWDYGVMDYVCDIAAIPVAEGSFDVVLCTEVLEHVPDPIAAMRELARVTTKGGRLLISAPLGSGIHQEPYHFYGGFSPYFYRHYLDKFGCDVVEVKPIGGLMRHTAQELHRAARALEAESSFMTPERRYLMMDWLPRVLSTLDDEHFIEQFTVGYLVEARKR